jgi:two-component system nitrogen regulation sensor histidine kinase NtrY
VNLGLRDASTSLRQSRFFDFLDRATKWLQEERYTRRLFFFLVALAVVAAVSTYLVFFRSDLLGQSTRGAIILLNIDLIVLLMFAVLVAARLARVWAEKRRGQAGSRLHVNLVLLFSLLTVMPAIVVTVLSGIFFNVGVNGWFSDRVRTALDESTAVAEAYFAEHQKVIGESVEGLAHILAQQMPELTQSPTFFNHALDVYAEMRSLSEVIVFDQSQVLGRSQLSFSLQFERISEEALEKASRGVVILSSSSGDKVRALRRIPDTSAYLLAGRFVDSNVSARIAKVREAVGEYHLVESKLGKLGVMFVQIFSVTCLLLLLVAVWVGLSFATRLARPIQALIVAAERVREGDWSVQVKESKADHEVGTLSRAFNRMTGDLQGQKAALMEANLQLDVRRRFIEDVLAGVTAGVISTSLDGNVRLYNKSAEDILGEERPLMAGALLTHIFPELAELLAEVRQSDESFTQSQLTFMRQNMTRTLLVRVVREHGQGYILTFDDITTLVNAQKKAAWSDVARRLAHEIKNPLTPIQLSAERLQRKYLQEITTNPENFKTCIATIIRQVEQIGHLVGEFSAFARMPAPQLDTHDLLELVRHAVFLQAEARPEIEFTLTSDMDVLDAICDATQFGQVFNNLLLNASEAVGERLKKGEGPEESGRVSLSFFMKDDLLFVDVDDNGDGFPLQDRDLLLEPYMTNRVRGTGLGLAIVKKIVSDHGGTVNLGDSPMGGARVQLIFPATLIKRVLSKKQKETSNGR